MSTTRSRKLSHFGPNDRLTGAITDPPRGRATIGAVIFGMGVGEVRVARALAGHGIATLQFREREDPDDWKAAFNTRGVDNFKEALEFLRQQRSIERFVCMGNCGQGSVAFRVAVDDPRIIGLILTNPHISPALTIRESYARRFLSLASWKKVLSLKANLRYHLPNARLLAMSLLKTGRTHQRKNAHRSIRSQPGCDDAGQIRRASRLSRAARLQGPDGLLRERRGSHVLS